MKTVYFVRHGESENNASDKYNMPDTPLSERGRKQAAQIAERCSKLPVEIIVSSPMKRAKDTAEAISERIGKKVEFSDFFVERRLSTGVLGKARTDPEAKEAIHLITEKFPEPGFRYEDAENFDDLKKRALNALSYLEERPEKHIVAVSHGFFMWMIVAAAVSGPELSGETCRSLIRGFGPLANTGLSVLTFGEDPRRHAITSPWQLRVWNDHAHLG